MRNSGLKTLNFMRIERILLILNIAFSVLHVLVNSLIIHEYIATFITKLRHVAVLNIFVL
jgi:hypothetical protein